MRSILIAGTSAMGQHELRNLGYDLKKIEQKVTEIYQIEIIAFERV